MYLLKLALRPWRCAPFSQAFSAVSVGFLLFLIGFLFWMHQGLKSVLIRLKSEQVVTAYIAPSVSTEDEAKLAEEIRIIVGHPHSTEITLIKPGQFVEMIKGQYPDLARELEDLGKDMFQVVPRYFSIAGILTDAAVEKIRSLPAIESAESSKDRYRSIVNAFSSLRWVVKILMGGVCLALLTGLIHLSRMNSYLHEDALALLRFWGAGTSVLLGPGTFSGLLVGILGGMIACGGWMTAGNWLAHHTRSLSTLLKGMPFIHSYLALALLLMGGLIGLLAGLLGSIPSQFRSTGGGIEA